MTGISVILIFVIIIAWIAGSIFIKNNNAIGHAQVLLIITAISAIGTLLAIQATQQDSGSGSGTESTTNSDSGTGHNDDSGSGHDSDSGTESTSDTIEISDIIHCETECEGVVEAYDSFSDINDHQRKDVIYMEYDGSPSSIIIHTNGKYSRISFDFYAAKGMEPNDMAALSLILDDDAEPIRETAAIPTYNSSGRFIVDINEANIIRITFRSSGTPSENYRCAILIDNFTLK